jgi:hypothetical protein
VMFMLGTALLSAGICIGLFALIAGIGLAASVFFSEQPQAPSGGIGPIDHGGNPRTLARIKPDTIRRPSPVSKRKRHFRRLGSLGHIDTRRKSLQVHFNQHRASPTRHTTAPHSIEEHTPAAVGSLINLFIAENREFGRAADPITNESSAHLPMN